MRIISDFHLHSKFSRATSRDMIIDGIGKWATIKGIDLVGTGDFTHAVWLSEIKNNLTENGSGLLSSKQFPRVKFILTAEISSIYSEGGKVRKIHTVVLAPDIKTVEKINSTLGHIGNLHSDGRPILGISAYDLAKTILDINPKCMIISAHAWTPWFSIFGSKSGYDSIKECYRDLTNQIYAIETGLSSDPEMNWRLSGLDNVSLISCSDAHSPANLGREATVFRLADNTDLSYDLITQMIKSAKSADYSSAKSALDYTIEFYPEEGKYHYDGHRLCNATRLTPEESKKINGICPVCKKPLTIGVMNRVEELADRPEGYSPKNFPGSVHLIPLREIIAETLNVAKISKKVQEEYKNIITALGTEFKILLDLNESEISAYNPKIAEGIMNMRKGNVIKLPGYDGVYGIIKVFGAKKKENNEPKQKHLF